MGELIGGEGGEEVEGDHGARKYIEWNSCLGQRLPELMAGVIRGAHLGRGIVSAQSGRHRCGHARPDKGAGRIERRGCIR